MGTGPPTPVEPERPRPRRGSGTRSNRTGGWQRGENRLLCGRPGQLRAGDVRRLVRHRRGDLEIAATPLPEVELHGPGDTCRIVSASGGCLLTHERYERISLTCAHHGNAAQLLGRVSRCPEPGAERR